MKKLIILSMFFFFSSFIGLQAFSLKDGFKFALDNDMDSKVNENNLKNIKYDQDIADSLYYPTVDFSAKVETSKLTQNQATPGDEAHKKSDEYELTFTQPLFDGFESKYEKKVQENRFKSAVYYLKESQSKVALDYSNAYINALREKDLLSLSNESLEISERIFNKVYRKVDAGYGTKLEFEEAKGNLAENRVNVDIQRINFKDSLENLKLYVQREFDSTELRKPNFIVELPKSLDEAIALALNNNPSVNVSKLNVDVALSEERKANKEFYPDLNFKSSYKVNNALYAEEGEEYSEYRVGLELTYNLYNGGKDSAQAKKALQNIKEKKFLIKKSEYQVKNRIRLAWNSYRLNKEKKENLEQFLLVRKDILDATIKEFDLGLKDLNSLFDIHIDYIDVKKDLISNSYDLLLAQYRVLDATGQLSEVLQDKLPTLNKIDAKTVDNSVPSDIFYNFDNKVELDKKSIKVIDNSSKYAKEETLPNINLQNNKPLIKKASFVAQEPVPVQKSYEVKKISSNDSNSFKERFLNASKDKYTINLALSNSEKRANALLEKYNLKDNGFYFSFRHVNPLQRIVTGIYDSKAEAKRALKKLHKNLLKNRPVVERITKKQNTYFKYHGRNDLNIQEEQRVAVKTNKAKVYKASFSAPVKKIIKKPVSHEYDTFKDEFLNAPKNKYTINIAFSDSKTKAKNLLKRHGLVDKGFVFQFRNEKPLQRIVYGVFDTKKEAKKFLSSLDKRLKRNDPVVERISIKQKVFHKYNSYNFKSDRLGSI